MAKHNLSPALPILSRRATYPLVSATKESSYSTVLDLVGGELLYLPFFFTRFQNPKLTTRYPSLYTAFVSTLDQSCAERGERLAPLSHCLKITRHANVLI